MTLFQTKVYCENRTHVGYKLFNQTGNVFLTLFFFFFSIFAYWNNFIVLRHKDETLYIKLMLYDFSYYVQFSTNNII